METAKLTSKGQIVIPKRIRDAVRAKPGTEFSVRLEGSRIILDTPRRKDRKVSDWTGLNPRGVRLTAGALCEPVTLARDVTLERAQVRSVEHREITHARRVA